MPAQRRFTDSQAMQIREDYLNEMLWEDIMKKWQVNSCTLWDVLSGNHAYSEYDSIIDRYVLDSPAGEKWCPECEQYLDESEFRTASDGSLRAYCHPCDLARSRRVYRENLGLQPDAEMTLGPMPMDELDVFDIQTEYIDGYATTDIAERWDVSISTIHSIIHAKNAYSQYQSVAIPGKRNTKKKTEN